MYKTKVIGEHDLILVKFYLKSGDDIAVQFNSSAADVVADPAFRLGFDAIIDYRGCELPEDQVYYNDLSRRVDIKSTAKQIVRIIEKDRKHIINNMKIFTIFFRNERFFEKVSTVNDVRSAFRKLGRSNIYEDYKPFFTD